MDLTAVALLVSLISVSLSADNAGGKVRSCADVRQFYSGKGFTLNGVPQSEISGEHLRICPQGYTCCTSAMEETLSNLSRREFEGLVREAGRSIQASLNAQYRTFDSESKTQMHSVPLSLECNRAIMKLVYCPHCRGLGSIKPCVNYCKNVMKGCLANQADLDTEWQSFIETMLQVASSFGAEPSMDTVIYSIPVRISEAVLAMQENMEIYTSKVFKACGDRGEEGTPSSISEEPKKKGSTVTVLEYKPSPKSAARLEVQVTDVSSKLKEMQFYWIQLPSALCSGKTASSTSSDKCWNGITKASYLPEVMGDGLANQINNPEVEIDITKPDRTIRQQIMLLKIMSNRLKNALNGNDVDFQDTSDDFSGSGSGMCADHLCVRGRPPVFGPKTDRPKLYAYVPENKRVKGSGNQIQPSVILLVLLLATLLLRR
ncbi:glypican-1-like [Sinocyclocheilus rhinocerous]|uniref:glypican-1-like n=1 Tax=Sinocyclocheilus rhinocerous TaxID=307959 RepID=UPI0007B9AFC6|nr:PREDICTED: glypican-1-like [Sinocyclocheilus rhinocerous]